MAKLDKSGIESGKVIQSADITNVYDALGGTGATDIMVSGTLSAMNGITVSGSIIPHSGSAYDLGSGTYPWKDLHLSGSTIYLWSSAGTAETLSRGNLQNIKEGKPLRGKGSLSSATLQCNFIYRDDDTADGDSTNRIALLNDRIYVAVNNLYAWDAKHSAGDGHRMSFGTYILTGQAANYYFAGSISSNNTISATTAFADAFVGDGSQLSSVTAEWDGTHDGDAEITGTLTAGALCADNIMYIYNGTYYSVEQQVAMLKTATGNLYSSITSNDNDISSINTSISGLETATGNLLSTQSYLISSCASQGNNITSLKTATGNMLDGTATFTTINVGTYQTTSSANYSSVLGGQWNGITGADYSAVLGGKHTSVTHDYAYSMGYNIDSVSANTTHVDQLYAKNLPNGDPSMAGILYTRTGSQLGMSGSTHCLSSSFVMVSNG